MQSKPEPKYFESWIEDFSSRARQSGVSQTTLDAAFQTVGFDPEIVAKDRNQPEFNQPIWTYLDKAVSDQRIAIGRQVLREFSDTLSSIEKHFLVDKQIVVAIWGLETSYGEVRGDHLVIEALASLAFEGRRREFFENELLSALQILQTGNIAADDVLGSWAGAMGHTQFMPSSYLKHGLDFDGDGVCDIWSDDPIDALASTASFLAEAGWQNGQDWGGQVHLPEAFDLCLTGKGRVKRVSDFIELGVRFVGERRIENASFASVIMPAGAGGPAFLITENFHVITRYNGADAYGLAVGLLADSIGGRAPASIDWPRDQVLLSNEDIREIQRLLSKMGHDTFGSDGMVGPNTSRAIQGFQAAVGLPADGHASLELLEQLRGVETK